MMKKRKFGSGGMPSIRESAESAERVRKLTDAEGLRMGVGQKPKKKPVPATRSTLPSMKATVDAGNRASKEDTKDFNAVKKYAKGGKVKRYADGDLVMGDAANKTSGLDLGLGLPKDIGAELSRAATDKELMDANLAAVRAREAASAAKPKPKPKPKPNPKPKPVEDNKPPAAAATNKPPTNKPLGMRVGSGSASAAKNIVKNAARDSGEAIKSVARGLGNAPSRASKALESANEQTKMQSRNMAKLREKNPNLVDRFIKMTTNPGRDYAKGGSVTRGDGIAKKGHTKGKMR